MKAGVSLLEVAKDVGVTPNAVWTWETSRRAPHGDSAVAYIEVLARLSSMVPEQTVPVSTAITIDAPKQEATPC